MSVNLGRDQLNRFMKIKTIEQLFWEKVQRSDGCWLWRGYVTPSGYGAFSYRPAPRSAMVNKRAHRIAWEFTNGSIPDGLLVCHHCDTPLCVRPDHLFLGTQLDNILDCKHKGRLSTQKDPLMRRHPQKLTADDVHAIRAAYTGRYGHMTELARQYGVSQNVIRKVIKRELWVHV